MTRSYPAIQPMQRAHRKLGVGGVDQHRELDLRRGDGADVDAAAGQRLEGVGGDAGVAAHADADHRDLGDVGRAVDVVEADRGLGLVQHVDRALIVGGRHREGEVGGGAVGGDVLHDHVDVDAGLGQRAEDRGGDARLVRHVAHRNLRLVLGEGDAGDGLLFHDILLVANQRARRRAVRVDVLGLVEARAHEDLAPCAACRARPSAPAAPWRRAKRTRASPRTRSCPCRLARGTMRGSVV